MNLVRRKTLKGIRFAVPVLAGVALLSFIFLGVAGIISPDRGEIILLFLEFLALVVAGYLAYEGFRLSK